MDLVLVGVDVIISRSGILNFLVGVNCGFSSICSNSKLPSSRGKSSMYSCLPGTVIIELVDSNFLFEVEFCINAFLTDTNEVDSPTFPSLSFRCGAAVVLERFDDRQS